MPSPASANPRSGSSHANQRSPARREAKTAAAGIVEISTGARDADQPPLRAGELAQVSNEAIKRSVTAPSSRSAGMR